MLDDLRDYGLIWQRRVRSITTFNLPSNVTLKASSRRFSPTRLATTLNSSSPSLPTGTGAASSSQQGFIVLETNYRVYAYTGMLSLRRMLNLQTLIVV